MKKLSILFISAILISSSFAQTYQWAKQIGSTYESFGNDIAVDNNGNVLIAGDFKGTADFDPGPGTANLTYVNGSDAFFAKYDSSGAYLWANQIGSNSGDYCNSIAVDDSGNVLITGSFGGTADFDPGADTINLTSTGIWDIYFAKYDSNGNYLWAKQIGQEGNNVGNGIAVDSSGNIFITGKFEDTTDFDPGVGVTNLISNGGPDIFFAKYDSNGNFIWAKQIGSTSIDWSNSIVVDIYGNVLITGGFSNKADFDPGVDTVELTSMGGSFDFFFAKYDPNGDYIWAKDIGNIGLNEGNSITLDGSGNILITGYFTFIVDFDPGAGTVNLGSMAGDYDIFFAKYDANGNYLWAKSIGSTGYDIANSIVTDGSENVLITGFFESTADFDPGSGTSDMTAIGGRDVFFAKYDASGNYLWAQQIGSIYMDIGYGIASDESGSVLITGYFQGEADFDPGPDTANLTFIGGYDVFFAKYDQPVTTSTNSPKTIEPAIGLNIYPNPNSGFFALEIHMPDKVSEIHVKIIDMLGREVYEEVMNPYSTTCKMQLDLDSYANGIYQLHVKTSSGTATTRVMVE